MTTYKIVHNGKSLNVEAEDNRSLEMIMRSQMYWFIGGKFEVINSKTNQKESFEIVSNNDAVSGYKELVKIR